MIQRKLLQETDLTRARAIALAQGFETADKNLKEIHGHKTESASSGSAGLHVKTEPVHKVSGKRCNISDVGARVICHRCGKPGHLATMCKHRESVCHKCKKKGHIAEVCRTKVLDQPTLPGRSKKNNLRQIRQVDEESDSCSDDSVQDTQELIKTVEQRQKGPSPPIKVHVEVDKVSIPMEVDTGASVAIISENTYHRL